MKIKNSLFSRRGQATTEVVLLFPIFFILTLFILKIYGLLVLMQKAEIASFYAARRWQLESHRVTEYASGWDKNFLLKDITDKVKDYIGYTHEPTRKFLSLRNVEVNIERTEFWQVVTLEISTYPPNIPLICRYDKRDICKYPYGEKCFRGYNYLCETGGIIKVIKNVPTRDRPISFNLPTSKTR